MTIRETSFRESDHPGIVFPGNVSSGKKLSGKRLSGKVTIRESYYPGNDCKPSWFVAVIVCGRRCRTPFYCIRQASEWSIQLRQFVNYFESDGEEWNLSTRRDLQRPRLCQFIVLSCCLFNCSLPLIRSQCSPKQSVRCHCISDFVLVFWRIL